MSEPPSPSPHFSARTERSGEGVLVVRLAGELDIATAPVARAELLRAVRQGPRVVAVDLGDLEFIDSNGSRLLLEAAEAAEAARVPFAVVASRFPGVRRTLALLGLERLLNLVEGLGDIEGGARASAQGSVVRTISTGDGGGE